MLEPGDLCALVGESSSGKSTVLSAIWTLLEPAAPMPTGDDVSRGAERVHIEARVGGRTIFLDARPPASMNLNRGVAPPTLFFPANLRPSTVLAPVRGSAERAAKTVRAAAPDGTGDWAAGDGGIALLHAVEALLEARVRGLVVLIEEETSSPVGIGAAGSSSVQIAESTVDLPEDDSPTSAQRSPGSSTTSRAVVLVEGRTEKLVLPFVFAALGIDSDREAITVVNCGGKGNIPLFAEICNACSIPYVVVHDRDAPRGKQPAEGDRIANALIARAAGRRRTVMMVPDFERVVGLTAKRGKPAAAWRLFQSGNGEVPAPLRQAVERVVAAARRAPRTSRGG